MINTWMNTVETYTWWYSWIVLKVNFNEDLISRENFLQLDVIINAICFVLIFFFIFNNYLKNV
jgi:hypothetical protein